MFRKKTGSFKFYPSEKEIQLNLLISKDELGGRYPKVPKLRAMRKPWQTFEWQPPGHHHTAYQWNLEYLWAVKGAKQTKKHKQQEAMQT